MSAKKELLVAVLLASAVWSLRWVILGFPPLGGGDAPMYLAMSNGDEGEPPWSFHILTPKLAGSVSPHEPITGFFAIAAFSFLVATVAVVCMLRARPFRTDLWERLFGAVLFMAVYPGVAMFRAYFLTDSLSYALLAVACAAVVHYRDGVLALVTLIGVFNRETAFFVAPVWLALNWGRYSFVRLASRSLLVFGPALIGYIVLHHTPLFFGHAPTHFNYLAPSNMRLLWKSTLSWLGTTNVPYGLAICVFLAYGPAWFVAGYGYLQALRRGEKSRTLLMPLGALAVPTILTLPIVDWRRGFQPIFPAVIAASVIGLRYFAVGRSRRFWITSSVATLLAADIITGAWWAPKISIRVLTAFAPWCSLLSFLAVMKVLSREGRHDLGNNAGTPGIVLSGDFPDSI